MTDSPTPTPTDDDRDAVATFVAVVGQPDARTDATISAGDQAVADRFSMTLGAAGNKRRRAFDRVYGAGHTYGTKSSKTNGTNAGQTSPQTSPQPSQTAVKPSPAIGGSDVTDDMSARLEQERARLDAATDALTDLDAMVNQSDADVIDAHAQELADAIARAQAAADAFAASSDDEKAAFVTAQRGQINAKDSRDRERLTRTIKTATRNVARIEAALELWDEDEDEDEDEDDS